MEKTEAEKEAINQVTQATIEGIKKGEQASLKLHQDAKVQSEEQTELAISKLKNKYDHTKTKVVAIVNNFGKIHSDLQDLKKEYIQQKYQISSLLQLNSTLSSKKQSENENQISKLKTEMAYKKKQVLEVVNNFTEMHSQLTDLKADLELDKKASKDASEIFEDSQLSELFAKQSKEMRHKISNGKKHHHKHSGIKQKLAQSQKKK